MRAFIQQHPMAWRASLWSVLFLLIRGFFLVFYPNSAFSPEEALRGTVGLEFLHALHGHALRLPFWCHQADAYLGGSLVTSALTAINYQIFGVRLFSLKLSAVYFSWGALLLFYRWLFAEAGPKVADAFALLYCFASPYFIALGLISMGYHTESVVFLAWILLSATAVARNPPGLGSRFSLGLAGGLGFWFSNINGLSFAAALAAYPETLSLKPARLCRLLAGFLIGLVPWILFNLGNDFAAFTHLSQSFNGATFAFKPSATGFFFQKIWLLLMRDIPLSFGLGKAGFAYAALIGGVLMGRSGGWSGRFKRFFVIYLLLFLVCYGLSGYFLGIRAWEAVHYRYLHQLLCLAYVALAFALGSFSWRWAALTGFVAFSVYGLALQEPTAPPGRVWSYRPDSYSDLGAKVMNTCYAGSEHFGELLQWMRSYPPTQATYLELPLVMAYEYGPLVSHSKSEEKWPWANPYFAEGIGEFFGESVPDFHAVISLGEHFQGREKLRYWRGVAAGTRFSPIVESELLDRMPADWRRAYLSFEKNHRICFGGNRLLPEADPWTARGQGLALVDCGIVEWKMGKLADLLANGQSKEFQENLAWGLGWRLRQRSVNDSLRAFDKIHEMPAWAWPKAMEGAVAFEADLLLPAEDSVGLIFSKEVLH